jgi:hypothetical protein
VALAIAERATVRVFGESELTLPSREDYASIALAEGQIHCDTTKSLTIETAAGSVVSEGGTFYVAATPGDPASTTVSVVAGTVRLSNAQGALIVGPSQTAVVTAVTTPTRLDPSHAREIERLQREVHTLRDENLALKAELDRLQTHYLQSLAALQLAPAGTAKETRSEAETSSETALETFYATAEKGIYRFMREFEKIPSLIEAFRKLGPQGIRLLAEILTHDESPDRRFLAALLFEYLKDPSSIPPLEAALKDDPAAFVRRIASHALANIEPDRVSVLLNEVFHNPQEEMVVRINAAGGLARLGHFEAIEFLEKFYEDTNNDAAMRLGALETLASVARRESAPFFRRILTSKAQPGYFPMAIQALEQIKDVEALPLLRDIADAETVEPSVRDAARKAYESILNSR